MKKRGNNTPFFRLHLLENGIAAVVAKKQQQDQPYAVVTVCAAGNRIISVIAAG